MMLSICDSASAKPDLRHRDACEQHMPAAAHQHGVPLGILYAVGLTESGRNQSLHPFALNIAGKTLYPASRRQALNAFAAARQNNIKLIDVGCMQVNHYWHGALFGSVADMFDPKRNVYYAARFLKQLYDKHGSWTLAAARYHAGPDNDPAQKRYVCRVIANMVRAKFAKWTSPARKFCRR